MRKIKAVCHINAAPPTSRIGAFLAVHRLLLGLQDEGHEVLCLVEQKVGDYLHEGIRYRHEGAFLAESVRRSDVVISNSGGSGHGHLAAVHLNKPSVVLAHSSSPGFAEQLVRWKIPELVVFNSHSLAELSGYTGRYVVCHPQIDPSTYTPVTGEHITLINLTDEKGAHTFDQLSRYLPDHKFLGVRGGYGEQLDIWRPNVTIADQTIRMADAVYSKTRILLVPSLLETWGLVATEAIASGIPVIAHPAMGLRESLGEAGIFCNRDNLDEWIDAIERLDDPDEYERQVKLCRERSLELASEPSVERFVRAVESVVP